MRELFRDGDWRIVAGSRLTAGSQIRGINLSDIQHYCPRPLYHRKNWWYYAYDKQCGVCHEEIPEPILGLKRLHNWDR